MRDGRNLLCCLTLLAVLTGLAACAPQEEGEDAAASEEWVWLEQTEQELEEKRRELAELEQRIESHDPEAVAEEGEEGEEGETTAPPTLEELEQRAEALREETRELATEFDARLTEFINSQDIDFEGEKTEVQRQALRMKSDEAIVAAQEFIDQGGDYRRAIDIYRQARVYDPDYERLQELIDEAEEMRWMTEERFAQVEDGMTQEEVREVLGPVYHRNVQEYPERGVLAWFYRKEGGGTAGVYFRERGGEWTVYNADFSVAEQEVREAG